MPYRTMSLEDFARLIGMDPRQVQREADHGQLPGRKVGGRWRFNRVQVHDWLQDHMLTLDQTRLREIDHAMGRAPDSCPINATGLIGVEAIELFMQGKTKTSVLRELVEVAYRTGLLYDKQELFQALRDREALGSTALPQGLAIPHPQRPMPYSTAEPLICVGRVINPVAFNAPDGALTQLFFLICSHDSSAHLHVLARLMRILDQDTIAALREVEDPADALARLLKREEDVVASLG